MERDEEVELFGLINIALNKRYMHLIYPDLKKIHKLGIKNNKIEFKTKVDLFSECSKQLAKIANANQEKMNGEKEATEMLDCCLRALLFSLMKLIKLLDTSKFEVFKYFL